MSNRPAARDARLLALLPAAGSGTRLPRRSGSKEMLTVPDGPAGEPAQPGVPVMTHLLRALRRAGVTETRVVVRTGKWDIPDYLSGSDWDDLGLMYSVTRGTDGVPDTVALGLRDCPEANVVFGFPDILFEPADAIARIVDRLRDGAADVVLGAFPPSNPSKYDMLELAADGVVTGIDIKPASSELEYAWILAAWSPRFTRWFLELMTSTPERLAVQARLHGDRHLGHALCLALDDGLRVEAEVFADGRMLDIGTPDDFDRAQRWFAKASPQ